MNELPWTTKSSLITASPPCPPFMSMSGPGTDCHFLKGGGVQITKQPFPVARSRCGVLWWMWTCFFLALVGMVRVGCPSARRDKATPTASHTRGTDKNANPWRREEVGGRRRSKGRVLVRARQISVRENVTTCLRVSAHCDARCRVVHEPRHPLTNGRPRDLKLRRDGKSEAPRHSKNPRQQCLIWRKSLQARNRAK